MTGSSSSQRVLLLIRDLEIGGAQRQIVLLARGLRQRGHDIRVASFYGGGAFETEVGEAGVPIIKLDKGGRWDVFGCLLRLRRVVREFAPHCVYAILTTPNIMGALGVVGTRVPIVFGIRASEMDLSAYDWGGRIADILERLLSRWAARIIVNSEKGREAAYTRGISSERVIVIHNGVDTARFRPNPQARLGGRERLGVAPNEKAVAAVGRLDPMKGHTTFLDAAAIMSRVRRDLRFFVVGNGPTEAVIALRTRAAALGLAERFDIRPACQEIEHLYWGLDLLVVSSRFGEGFPNVLAEAMACGVPTVSTRVGDAAAILGDEALVAEPDDPESLAEVALSALHRSVGELPQLRIRRLFSLANMLEATERALAEATSLL